MELTPRINRILDRIKFFDKLLASDHHFELVISFPMFMIMGHDVRARFHWQNLKRPEMRKNSHNLVFNEEGQTSIKPPNTRIQ